MAFVIYFLIRFISKRINNISRGKRGQLIIALSQNAQTLDALPLLTSAQFMVPLRPQLRGSKFNLNPHHHHHLHHYLSQKQ